MVKNLSTNAGDTGLIPGSGRSHTPCSGSTCVPQLRSPRVCMPGACAPQQEKSALHNEDPVKPTKVIFFLIGGKFKRERIWVYLWLINVVWQKATQHCKVIILQLNIFFKKEMTVSGLQKKQSKQKKKKKNHQSRNQ